MKILFGNIMNKMFEKFIEGISQMLIYWGSSLICSKVILNYAIKVLSNSKKMEMISKILVTSSIQGSNLIVVNKIIENSSNDLAVKVVIRLIDSLNPFMKVETTEIVVNTVAPNLVTGFAVAKNIIVDNNMDFLISLGIHGGGSFMLVIRLLIYINPHFFEHIQSSIKIFKDTVIGKNDDFADFNIFMRVMMAPWEAWSKITYYDLLTISFFVGFVYISYKFWNSFRNNYNNIKNIIENE